MQAEARNSRSADEVRVSIILYHERSMIDQSTTAQTLNYKILARTSTVVGDRDFNNTLMDQDQLVGYDVLLTNRAAFLVSDPLLVVNYLLVCCER